MVRNIIVLVPTALAVSSGCAHGEAVSESEFRDASMRSVAYRASFNLACPEEEIEVRCLDSQVPRVCFTAGASGCGRRSSYVSTRVADLGWNRRLHAWALEGVWTVAPGEGEGLRGQPGHRHEEQSR